MPSGLAVTDKNLKVVYTNAAFRALFPAAAGKGSLGKVTGCTGDVKRCGFGDCVKNCSLVHAFEDALYSARPNMQRVSARVRGEDGERELSFVLTVKPVGDGLCMGVIDDALQTEIAGELMSAKNIQQKLLPAGKWVAGKRYSYMYIPCRDIGGDLPEIYAVGDSACGVIADVSGKGISAGMLTAFVKAAYDKKERSPAKAIEALSARFNELGLDEKNYITVAAARIDRRSITYSMAGHNVPILLKSGGGITRIMLNSPPVSNWFEDPKYFEDTIPYKKGDILALLTDGLRAERRKFVRAAGIQTVVALADVVLAFIGISREQSAAVAVAGAAAPGVRLFLPLAGIILIIGLRTLVSHLHLGLALEQVDKLIDQTIHRSGQILSDTHL